MATHPAYNAKGEVGKVDPLGSWYAHRPSSFLNLYNPNGVRFPRSSISKHFAAGRCPVDCPAAVPRMPALQYLSQDKYSIQTERNGQKKLLRSEQHFPLVRMMTPWTAPPKLC